MTYRAWEAGGLGFWAPSVDAGTTTLLLGRTALGWRANAATSRIPRAYTAAGRFCIAVNVPNWGNQTDLNTIDTALTAVENAGRDVSTVELVAVGAGGPAAINWAVRHIDRVHAIRLVSAVVDLEEHYTRVTGDQAAIDTAHGGDFLAVASTWNANDNEERPWGRRVREWLADRLTVLYSDDDTTTPATVQKTLAAYYGAATRALEVTGDITVADAAWLASRPVDFDNQAGAARWQMWSTYRRNNTSDHDWAGGDGHKIVGPTSDGRWYITHSDWMRGPVNSDETRNSVAIVRNSIVVEEADGSLGATLHHPNGSGTGPTLIPDDAGSGFWYWINYGIIEGDLAHLFCLHVLPGGGFGFQFDGFHIVTVDTTIDEQVDTQDRGWNNYLWGLGVVDGWVDGYSYIFGERPTPENVFISPAAVARWPTGNVTGAWEFWAGDGWSDTETDAVGIRDKNGNEIPAVGPVQVLPDGRWIMLGKTNALSHDMFYWVTAWPPVGQGGGWELWQTRRNPEAGWKPYGGNFLTYGPAFLPHAAPDGRLLVSYSRNWQAPAPNPGGYSHASDSALYQPRYYTLPLPPRGIG